MRYFITIFCLTQVIWNLYVASTTVFGKARPKNKRDYWRWIKNSRRVCEIRFTRWGIRLFSYVSKSDVDRPRGQWDMCSSGKKSCRRGNGRASAKRIEKNRSRASIENVFASRRPTTERSNSASLRLRDHVLRAYHAVKDFCSKAYAVAARGWKTQRIPVESTCVKPFILTITPASEWERSKENILCEMLIREQNLKQWWHWPFSCEFTRSF